MGVKLARPEAEVVSIVGDGTYQMLPMELATVVQENIKVIYVLLQNYGFCSIGALSESRGLPALGTKYRQRGEGSHLADEQVIDASTSPPTPAPGGWTSSRSTPSRSSRRPTARPRPPTVPR